MLVTRPIGDAQGWVDQFQGAGFDVLNLPLIEIAPVTDQGELESAWRRISGFDAVMFVSGNAVSHFFAARPTQVPLQFDQLAGGMRAWGTGPGTQRALLAAGVIPSRIDAPGLSAQQFDSQALWDLVRHQVIAQSKALIVRGTTLQTAGQPDLGSAAAACAVAAEGRDWLAQRLLDCGCAVEIVIAYQRIPPAFTSAQESLVHQAASDGTVWVLSSSEAVNNLAAAFPRQPWEKARAVATHPRIAQCARRVGFGVVCESRPAFDSVVASIESME